MIHVVHGIRTGPESPLKGILKYLPADAKYVDYGYELELETRFINPMIGGTMLPYIGDGDICIGHSNGCAIIHDLMMEGAPIKGAIFFNGALSSDFAIPTQVEWIDVYSNEGDQITELAEFGERLHLVAGDWGELGHTGYTGVSPKVTNIYCDHEQPMPAVHGHSAVLIDPWFHFAIGRRKTELGL